MNTRDSTEFSSQKTTPHHRLTFKDVLRDYEAGLITTTGAIFYIVSSSRKPGYPVRVSVQWICKTLDICRASYYRAIGKLSDQSRLQINAPDEMELTIPVSTNTGVPDYIVLEELSQKCDTLSQICDENSQKCDTNSHKCDTLSHERDTRSPEPRQRKEPTSPQLLQLDQLDQLTTEEVPTTHPVVVEEMKDSGMELTESQLHQIDSFSEEQVREAFQVVQNSKQPKDKIRLFFKALRNGYRSHLPSGAAANFRDWFEKARIQGHVIASQMCADGILRVLMPDDRWLPLADAILEVSGS